MNPETVSGNKVVLWDFNGTLLDDVAICVEILNRMLGSRGLSAVTKKEYLEVFRFPIADYYQSVGFDFTRWPYEDLAVEFMDSYMPASLSETRLRPGVMDALEAFAQAGVRQVMLSASHLDYLKLQAAHFGIDGYFDSILGLSHIHGTGKAEIGRDWADRQLIKASVPPVMVLIGDTCHDSEVARAMGARCVLAAGGHNSLDRLMQAGADAVHDNIADAALAVQKLLGDVPSWDVPGWDMSDVGV